MRIIVVALGFLLLCSCKTQNDSSKLDESTTDSHPSWIMQGNIYEVNTRQYTPEGTFNAFAKHLDRLKEMGVQTLWFMPINPISLKDRKRDSTQLGSYYAVADYRKINPEYGNMDDWKNLVKTAHEKGFKVIIDWVPTHSGADHYWLNTQPDFYEKDSLGNPISQFDWTDTRKLNYKNPALVDSMIECMKFWIKETNIDGYRCDVAGEVPNEFWAKCIPELRKMKNVFMLAEGDKPSLHEVGFDASYTWEEFDMMKRIARGERKAVAIDSILAKHDTLFPKNSIRMYFTSNHDENSWNKADFGTMPGEIHAPFAVITQTLKRTVPLIYGGQEEPFLDSLKFFVKDTIIFGNYKRQEFYKKLLTLRKENDALAANASYTRINTNNDANIFAFVREMNKNKVVVITNLSAANQSFSLNNNKVNGEAKELFSGKKEKITSDQMMSLPAWGYTVLVY
ncbi:MAG: alpha-glucosidase C-terminal domain-containing protein [Chitinophagaceae bacterium]|nr:alpha-glucosidase C-terminal domain-containing protein [Chitinophagaceae bacterium]